MARLKSLSSLLGNYLADNGYILVRPMGGLCRRGATGVLPALEFAISRALAAKTGDDFAARVDFRGAMEKAGYWRNLVGPITRAQAAAWTLGAAALVLQGPLTTALGVGVGFIEALVTGQVISPGTLAGATAVLAHSDCFDINSKERAEPAAALIFKDCSNKAAIYRLLVTEQAKWAPNGAYSVYFAVWLGLTGLDDVDPTVRETYLDWYAHRQSRQDEWGGRGSKMAFAAAVAAISTADLDHEATLMARIDHLIVKFFRSFYFSPPLPIIRPPGEDHLREEIWGDAESVLDLGAALAVAFWHADRRSRRGAPLKVPRFPLPPTAASMKGWPPAGVPVAHLATLTTVARMPIAALQGTTDPIPQDGLYPLFPEGRLVPRRTTPPIRPASRRRRLVIEKSVTVRAQDRGDVATDILVEPSQEVEIDASGTIHAGVFLDARNTPDGHDRLVDDARWPLHTGLDPTNARAFCLLGRLNGYFFVGSSLPRTRFIYPKARPLFLRINDNNPGDGDGQFDVTIRIFEVTPDSGSLPAVNLLLL
jgi:hypothetical protein